MSHRFLTITLSLVLTTFSLFAQQEKRKAAETQKPLVFLDGKLISQEEMQKIDANDVAILTILKEEFAIKQYGENGKAGVILIESKKQSRDRFQKYLSSKSPEYKSLLERKKGSDENLSYVLDGKLLKKDYEGDLASIADSNFNSIEIIDSLNLVSTYNITNKFSGVVITTVKGTGKKTSSSNINNKFDPQLLILAPGKTSFSPQAAKEVEELNTKLRTNSKEATGGEEGLAENLKLMNQSTNSFMSNLDFFKQITLISQDYLTYRFYERFPKTLILVKDTSVENGASLAKIADLEQMPYVLAFPSVNLIKEKNGYIVYLKVQLFEQESNSLIIDKEYKGSDQNPGFEFSCKDGSLNCTINNALSEALKDVIQAIAQNNSTLKAEKALLAERIDFIRNDVYPKTFDLSLLQQAISDTDNSINFKDLYQCLYSPEQDKFVAFFCGSSSEKSLKSMSDGRKAGNVNIISSKNLKDKNLFDEMPRTYAYIVRGLLFNGRWYYQKGKATYFDPQDNLQGKLEFLSNLHQWDYFKEDSAEPNPNFWQGKLFTRVPDLRKDPKWQEYKAMWEQKEKQNRDYIGMYELVASTLRAEKEEQEEVWQDSIRNNVFAPFYQGLAASAENDLKGNSPILNKSVLIYNKTKTNILNPEQIKDAKGNTYVRFFLFEASSGNIFEWTYFPPYQKKKGNAENGVMSNLNTVTDWNYSFDTLDDENFWNNCVLLKDNGKFKYLTRLK